MHTVSYSRHRFPAEVIQHAVWLFFRFPLSFGDVEGLLAQRSIDVSDETVLRWSIKFGPAYAKTLERTHPQADTRWHVDEVFVSINGISMYLWRAVDWESEVLGCVGAISSKQSGRVENYAKASQVTRLLSNRCRDTQTAPVWRGAE